MLNSLLSLINQEGSLGFGEACVYALIGFLLVFAGIVIIILIIWLIGLLMRKTNNLAFLSRIGRKKQPLSEQPAGDATSEEDIPDEVKAAIVAAIMAYYSEAPKKCDFKVKRIKRI